MVLSRERLFIVCLQYSVAIFTLFFREALLQCITVFAATAANNGEIQRLGVSEPCLPVYLMDDINVNLFLVLIFHKSYLNVLFSFVLKGCHVWG